MSVLGVYGVSHAASLIYYGLHTMQHRGQEGCGIVSVEAQNKMHRHRGKGLVSEVFNEAKMAELKGSMAIGHVLYTGAASRSVDNFAVANNGNIVNAQILRDTLESKGSLFHSMTDSELLAHLIKKESPEEPRINSIISALNLLEGAFAFLIMTKNRIYACRDKYGMHPLSIGRIGEGYVVASESCAFDTMGAEFLRDIEPGEIVTIRVCVRRSIPTRPTVRCVLWSTSTSRVPIAISRVATYTPTVRSRVADSTRRLRSRQIL